MILIKTWPEAQDEAYFIRRTVFIEEQGVPEELELDEFDPIALHALVYHQSQCMGTGRLIPLNTGSRIVPLGRIGRMAILPQYRKQNMGKQLLQRLIQEGRDRGITHFELHAQLSAIPFYEKSGFIAHGAIYDEAGITHRDMMFNLFPSTYKP
ncbi:GNAT family N-acetyltransferase [Polynucleobacter antarcticus]|uniref:GNAT family N-acetyltransferase n=1 Tax=Polynucleobacter antarcticus TaxID=1743162 RepID=A0A6M9PV84_9BURK|nr:GNAT family N-acetyltransferase [Polynucleobacter antarcticus]QKM62827.1 GNAT family N-acetyltransferase [Polynucleobacter antarcticus]